ncbi:S-adenosylmethionine decarboxylase [bacterium]|nr:S-adenosylmethionine decarboxylase [bacterium]
MSRDAYKRTLINGVPYYGKHMMLTAVSCNENLLDLEKIGVFMKRLVKEIDMVAFGEPVIARFGDGIEIGISAVQLIQTSAIVIHTNDGARDMYLDVFSCKWFDESVVKETVQKFFDPGAMSEQIVLRK